jgi:nucleotide-binding universal stress UspA family protein
MFEMKKILLPVDFSERAYGAARYAEALAEHYGAEVTMVHVIPAPHYEFGALEAGGSMVGELYASRKKVLEQQCARFLTKELPNLKARRIVLEGDPAQEIVRFAHDEGFDLIVMPTHGYGPFRRFILGSTTSKVLHDSECPVWTGVHLEAAPAPERIKFETVVAALDLKDHSDKVLRWAHEFCKSQSARLTILHVTPSLEGQAGEYFDPDWRLHLKRQAMEAIEALQQRVGSTAEVAVDAGEAHKMVCDYAKTSKADLLVIGRGSATGVFGRLRTHAYSIVRGSPCPVVSV